MIILLKLKNFGLHLRYFFNFMTFATDSTISAFLLFSNLTKTLFFENFLKLLTTSNTEKPLPYPQFNMIDLFVFDTLNKTFR